MLNAGITKSAGKNDSNRNISIYVSMAKTNNVKEHTRLNTQHSEAQHGTRQ
jgi:hypothetical protein